LPRPNWCDRREAVLDDQPAGDQHALAIELVAAARGFADQHEAHLADASEQRAQRVNCRAARRGLRAGTGPRVERSCAVRHELPAAAHQSPITNHGFMHIGPYRIDPPLVLAPMAGVTDKPFRLLAKRMGAGYAVSEMTISDPRLWQTKKSLWRMDHAGEPDPVGVQIAGADPQRLAEAARHNVAHGAQIIDLNMGCPAKKVCNVWAGSALLQDEALVARICAAVVAAVAVPVTLKIRTGWARDQRNALAIARIAEDCGIAALAVHGRTRDQHYSGAAEYDTIAAVKQAVRIPVLANGDIDSPQKAAEVLRRTGADALMIGRGAQGRPWLFREIAHYLATGELLPPPDAAEVGAILLGHLDALHAFYGEEAGVRIARKHLGWYAKDRPENAAFRAVVNQAQRADEQRRLTAEYFARLAEAAQRQAA
jgi:tRNA-dihydrouridine synthase B